MLQVSLFLLPPSTNFIVMAPRVHPCPIAQELPGNVGWTLQMTEERKQRHPQKNRKSHQKKTEEKDRNLQWQLCFHVWLHSLTHPKQGSCGYDWRCDCLALFLPAGSAVPTWRDPLCCLVHGPKLHSTPQAYQGFWGDCWGSGARQGTWRAAGWPGQVARKHPACLERDTIVVVKRFVLNASLSSSVCP